MCRQVVWPTRSVGKLKIKVLIADNKILYFADLHLGIFCNENQPDALFMLNLFRQSTSTCFRDVYCPSLGGIQQLLEFHPELASSQST
jgi:hypothetical protein